MSPLFDNDARYTPVALAIDEKIREFMDNLMTEYVTVGYSPRDIATICYSAVMEAMCDAVIGIPEKKLKNLQKR